LSAQYTNRSTLGDSPRCSSSATWGERDPHEHLQRLDADDRAVQRAPRAHPLDEQRLVLPPQRAGGAVGAHRDQAEERVEVEARQRAVVAPLLEIALDDLALPGQRQRHRAHGRDDRERRRRSVDPHQTDRGDHQLERRAHELGAEARQLPHQVQRVAALRHVRDGAAVEVAIAEPRDLGEERRAEPRLEAPSQALHAAEDRRLQQREQREHAAERRQRAQPLPDDAELSPDVEQAAEQQRLEQAGGGGHGEREGERRRTEGAVLAQQPPELAARADRRLRQRRGEIGRQRRLVARRGGATAVRAHHHHAAHREPLGIARARAHRPHRLRDRVGPLHRLGEEGARLAAPERASLHQPLHHAQRRVQRGHAPPRRIGERGVEQLAPGDAEPRQPAQRHLRRLLRACPLAPLGRAHLGRVDVELVAQPREAGPAPPHRRIHDLHAIARAAPQHDEVREAVRQAHHRDAGQGGLVVGEVLDRHHHLLGVDAELARDVLERVDGRAVDVGLAGLAQAAVADGDAEPVEQRLERGRAAVHARGLDDLRDRPPHRS
jgi:hypothetical protein